jgi:hypothetical protein
MPDKQPSVSDAWMAFTREAPKHAQAWMQAAEALAEALPGALEGYDAV